MQPVREAVSYRGLFTAGWFGVREKHCSRLEIYDRLQASEHAGLYLKKQISLKNCIIIRDSRGDFEICIISSRNRRFDSGHENIMEDIIEDFILKNTKRMILFSRT